MAPLIPIIAIAGAVIVVPGRPAHTVDFDKPGTLDRIAVENPAHYRRLVEVLDAASVIDCQEMPGKLYVKFNAAGSCTAPNMLLTSFPAKRRIAVTLDDTGYVGNVVIRTDAGRMVPAFER